MRSTKRGRSASEWRAELAIPSFPPKVQGFARPVLYARKVAKAWFVGAKRDEDSKRGLVDEKLLLEEALGSKEKGW